MIERKQPLLDTFVDVENGGEGVDTAIRKFDKEFDNVIEGANDTDKRLGELKEAFDEAEKIDPNDYALKEDIPTIAAGSGINVEVNQQENKISVNIPVASASNPDPGLISQSDIELLDSLRETGTTVSNHVNNVNIHVPEANPGSDVNKVLKVSPEGTPAWEKEAGAAWGKIEGNITAQADLAAALDGKALKAHKHDIPDVNGLDVALEGKAPKVHGHKISDTDGLQVALASKANTEHKHEISDVNNLSESLGTLSENIESNRTTIGEVDTKADGAITAAGKAKETADQAKEKADTAVQGIVAGDNITIISQGNNTFKISSTGTGGGGTPVAAEWGNVGGILSNQLDLKEALDNKAAANHTHGIATIDGLQDTLNGKAAKEHEHTISNVTGLQDALNKKSDTTHGHDISGIRELQTTLNNMTKATNDVATTAGEAVTTAGEAMEAAQSANNKTIQNILDNGNTAAGQKLILKSAEGASQVTESTLESNGFTLKMTSGTHNYQEILNPLMLSFTDTDTSTNKTENLGFGIYGFSGSASAITRAKNSLGIITTGDGTEVLTTDGTYKEITNVKFDQVLPYENGVARKVSVKFSPSLVDQEYTHYKFRVQLSGHFPFAFGTGTNYPLAEDFTIDFVTRGKGDDVEVLYFNNSMEWLLPDNLTVDGTHWNPREMQTPIYIRKIPNTNNYYLVFDLGNFNSIPTGANDIHVTISAYPETAKLAGADFLAPENIILSSDWPDDSYPVGFFSYKFMNNSASAGANLVCLSNQAVGPTFGTTMLGEAYFSLPDFIDPTRFRVEASIVAVINDLGVIQNYPISAFYSSVQTGSSTTQYFPLQVLHEYNLVGNTLHAYIPVGGKTANQIFYTNGIGTPSPAGNMLSMADQVHVNFKIIDTSLGALG